VAKKRSRMLEVAVERAVEKSQSRQPRLSQDNNSLSGVFDSIYSWAKSALYEEPAYTPNTRQRDKWLSEFWRREPHLAGVLNTMIDIDKNRGWSITGGRNQVRQFSDVLYRAEAGRGWRHYASFQSTSFYTTDIGAVTEIGREAPSPFARFNRLYHVDPTECALIAHQNDELPELDVLEYEAGVGGVQFWKSWDFFRTVSMPDIRDRYHGAGWCAVSRCLELAKLMIAVFEHDKEELGAAAPRGFLALNGYTKDQWEMALAERAEQRDNAGHLYYNDVMVLTSNSIPVDLKLVSLSQLPMNFDLEKFVQTMMQGYALCFGIDVGEIYSVRAGAALGVGTQSQVQSAKARTKGENSFWLNIQENIQREMPETLDFEVDQRSDEGDKIKIEVQQLKANLITTLYESVPGKGGSSFQSSPKPGGDNPSPVTQATDPAAEPTTTKAVAAPKPAGPAPEPTKPLLSWQEARRAIIEMGVLPKGLLTDDNATAEISDIGIERAQARDNYKVRMAAERWPSQEIVRRDNWGRETVLWNSGDEMLSRKVWQGWSEKSHD